MSLSAEQDRILMIGHLLEYHPVMTRLKQMIESKELGDIYYIYTQRVNLGVVRNDENALWNFSPHDISSILYLLGKSLVMFQHEGSPTYNVILRTWSSSASTSMVNPWLIST